MRRNLIGVEKTCYSKNQGICLNASWRWAQPDLEAFAACSGVDGQELGVTFWIVTLNRLAADTNEGEGLEVLSFELAHDLFLRGLVSQIVVGGLEWDAAFGEKFLRLVARWTG